MEGRQRGVWEGLEGCKGEARAKTREAAKGLGVAPELLERIHETGTLPPNFPVRPQMDP